MGQRVCAAVFVCTKAPSGGRSSFDPAMSPPIRRIFRVPSAVLRLLVTVVMFGLACPCPAPAAPDAAGAEHVCPLGATPPQIVARYGPVLRHNARVRHHQVLDGGTILDGDLHGKNGMIIRVVYHQGYSVLLEFTRATGPLTAADVNTLLTSCAAASTWEMGKDSTDAAKFYHRADGKAVAHWSTPDDGSLLVASEDEGQAGNLTDRLLQ